MDTFQSYILNSTSECWKCNAGYFYMYFSSSDMIYPINSLYGFVLLCFVVVMSSVFSGLTWCIYPYLAGLLLWPWGLICLPQYQKKQPWRIRAKWIITKPQQNTRNQKSFYTLLMVYCKCFSFCSVSNPQQNKTQQDVKMWTYCKCFELPGRDFPWWLSAAGSKQAIIDTASKLCWEEKICTLAPQPSL